MSHKTTWASVALALLFGVSLFVAAETPDIGQKAPDFTLSTPEGHPLSLSGLTSKGTVVLIVLRGFPGYQCPYCQRQVHDFVTNSDRFAALGVQVLLVYPDRLPISINEPKSSLRRRTSYPQTCI